jgi:hypothetical protein
MSVLSTPIAPGFVSTSAASEILQTPIPYVDVYIIFYVVNLTTQFYITLKLRKVTLFVACSFPGLFIMLFPCSHNQPQIKLPK